VKRKRKERARALQSSRTAGQREMSELKVREREAQEGPTDTEESGGKKKDPTL